MYKTWDLHNSLPPPLKVLPCKLQFFSTNSMIPSPKTASWWVKKVYNVHQMLTFDGYYVVISFHPKVPCYNPSWTTVLLLFFLLG